MTTAMPEPPAPATRHSFFERVIGALRLDARIYDEIEHDESALGQALGVVALAALAAAIGSAGRGGGGAVGSVFGALLGWLVSAGFIWAVGVYWMRHTSDYRELLRTLGFANAPNLVAALGVVPVLGGLAILAAGLWSLAAFVVAVRQALDVSTGRAIWVCILAVLLNLACVVGLALLFGGLVAGTRTPGTVGF